MVTKKPLNPPPLATSNVPPSSNAPPYPSTPRQDSAKTTASSNTNSIYSPDLSKSPAFDLIDVHEAREQHRARSESDASSHGTWDSDDTDQEGGLGEDYVEVPKPLQLRFGQKINGQSPEPQKREELPASLRIGPADKMKSPRSPSHAYEDETQSNPWAVENADRRPSNPRNPYLKQNGFAGESSQSAWQEVQPPPPPNAAPPMPPSNAPPPPPVPAVELPTVKTPSDELRQMSLDSNNHHGSVASWETVEKLQVPHSAQAAAPEVVEDQPGAPHRPVSTWWQQEQHPDEEDESAFAAPPVRPPKEPAYHQNEEIYDPPPGPPPMRSGTLIDHEDSPPRIQRRPVPTPITTSQISIPQASTIHPASRSSEAVPETPGTILKRQRNENYSIKHINWFDASRSVDPRSRSGLRNSPLLVQNANGPCPLLALVNALVFSTPHNTDTALIETLRSREQISLGLLLDAVFEELMSGRRGDTAQDLPDVSELYSFLLALHTGMNVNPRFVTPVATPCGSWDGIPQEMSGMHPALKAQHKAGAFEETREMRLYSTFNVPLIHGWIPPVDTPAYDAFVRSAQTFEDAQNIQFLEAELEDKLRTEGLARQEQQTLQDIQTIKAFLNTWPTQLTDYGLETMSKSLQPGQIAILFRNDHFSTVYKEPKHGALMTLVTDAGYSSHDEIVWESLVDVTGASSEMFSGDFRVVSHGQNVRLNQGNSGGGEEGWQQVQSRNRYHGQRNSQSPDLIAHGSREEVPPPLPGPRPPQPNVQHDNEMLSSPVQSEAQRKASEQEDHDLALALQLQEEEEEQHRQAELRRERELSERFINNENNDSNSNEGPRPPIPPRRGAGRGGTSAPNTAAANVNASSGTNSSAPAARPAVNRPADADDPDAPPSYEQAASDRPYRPAGSTAAASLSQGNPLGAYDALRRQQQGSSAMDSAGGQASPPYTASVNQNQNRRRSDVNRGGRRRSSYISPGGPSAGLQSGYVAPGHTPTSPQSGYQRPQAQGRVAPGYLPSTNQATGRVNQAATIQDTEDDRCVLM